VEHEIKYSEFSSFTETRELFEQQASKLNNYIDQLLWWNQRVNLVSRDVSRETIREHVLHSLMVSASGVYKGSKYIIDAGTGGGLPGIPLSIVNTEKKMVLNDVVSKKIMACKQMILKLGLENCSVEAHSIENVEAPGGAVIISKHAFKLNDLIRLVSNKPWSGMVLLKGSNEVEDELDGIEEKLDIKIFSLEQERNSFYDGKALVEITR
jgi:16S rRNA (guanine527-N7)-methyltransferase